MATSEYCNVDSYQDLTEIYINIIESLCITNSLMKYIWSK